MIGQAASFGGLLMFRVLADSALRPRLVSSRLLASRTAPEKYRPEKVKTRPAGRS
jgi:hypothetical protein